MKRSFKKSPTKTKAVNFFPPRLDPLSAWFYLAVVLAAWGPCFLTGQAYFGDDLLSIYGPQHLFFKNEVFQGHWPLWCPYLFGGQPFWADPNAMGLYPFYLLVAALPIGWSTTVFCALHLLIALLGAHLWFRALGLSQGAARIGALTFALAGFFWWEIIHPPILAAFAWMPWWAWALENFSKSLRRGWAFICGLCFAFIFLCGSFQMTLAELYMGAFYFLLRFASGPLARQRMKGRALMGLVLVFIWACLPIWAFWIPVSEFFSHSVRVLQAFDFEGFNADLCLTPRSLTQFLFPVPAFDEIGNPLPYPGLLGNAGCLGIWAFLLGGFALLGKNKRAAFWSLGVGWVWVLVAMGRDVPLFKWLCEYVAGFAMTRSPFRFVFLFVAAGSLLAALGFEYLEARKKPELKRTRFWVFLYALILGAVCLFVFHGAGTLTGLLAGGTGLWIWLSGSRFQRGGYWIFAASLALSMILNGWAITLSKRGPDSNFDFLKNRPELTQVKQMAGGGRVFIGDGIPYPVETGGQSCELPLPTDVTYPTQIRHVKGYNPLSLWATSEIYEMPILTLSRLMAVNLIATGAKKKFPPPEFAGLKAGPFYLYYAKKPFPFVYAPKRFEAVESGADRLALMDQKGFNPYELSYFSQSPPAGYSLSAAPVTDVLSYQLIRDNPDDQVFQVNRQKGGWTVFSEVVYPGWKAFLDGKPVELLTANHVFRAVFVPAGNHEVRFSYEPVWWTPIRVGLLLWFLSVLGLLWKPWRRWTLGI